MGQRKDYWGPLEALEQVAPDSSEIVKSVQNLPNIRYMYQCCMRAFPINIDIQPCKVQAQWVTSPRDRSLWLTALSLLLLKKNENLPCHRGVSTACLLCLNPQFKDEMCIALSQETKNSLKWAQIWLSLFYVFYVNLRAQYWPLDPFIAGHFLWILNFDSLLHQHWNSYRWGFKFLQTLWSWWGLFNKTKLWRLNSNYLFYFYTVCCKQQRTAPLLLLLSLVWRSIDL